MVAISIAWIPLIQQMQGGQLYIYIQSIAAYLSPPIAMIFCMAIIWPRMNEMVTRVYNKAILLYNIYYTPLSRQIK